MKENNLVLTGGHAGTTAYSFIKEFKKNRPDCGIYWLGAKRAIEGSQVSTIESKILPKEGVSFHPLFTGRLQRRFSLHTIPSVFKIPVGVIQALVLLSKIRPKVILSFGGYASFPVVLAGNILSVPIVIHEQTATVGRANKIASYLAEKIALARESSRVYYPKKKSVLIGNPLLPGMEKIKARGGPGEPPTILVTAGSRGSQTINRLLTPILEELLKNFKVIHVTGEMDFDKFRVDRKNYQVFSSLEPEEITGKYEEADMIIARGGANTVSEIIAAKRPALIIPLPFSFADEQTKNAILAEEFGIARVLNQESLTPKKLLNDIFSLWQDWGEIVKKVKGKKSPDIGAAKRLSRIIETYL